MVGEGSDSLRGGLKAAEERGDEDAVDRSSNMFPDLLAGVESQALTRAVKRRVPGAVGHGGPELIEVIEARTVPHYNHVLVHLPAA